MQSPVLSALSLLALSSLATGQSNQNPNIDVFLGDINNLTAVGHLGSFPNGVNGLSFGTTICNGGPAEVDWLAPMDPRHPFISFLVVGERDGRMQQISDRSFVKHGFFAANSFACGGCTFPAGPSGAKLGLGCSDTYKIINNSDRFWLGPAEEIDPWLGLWDPQCSYFDQGDPAVSSPADCNGSRSLTRTQVDQFDSVKQRIEVRDADLQGDGPFYYQAQYTVAKESEALRADNLGSRSFNTAWNGSSWVINETGALVLGPVLGRWSGATLASGTNGADDGRVYVALKVSQVGGGMYHYEYALQNRDNARGVEALRIPICSEAKLTGFGFSDVDNNAANAWSASLSATEIVFSSSMNPLRWNTIYNIWFDSDAAPEPANLTLDAFDAGPGNASFGIALSAPTGHYNLSVGAGCAAGTPAELYASGTPARALLGNASFGLESSGNLPGARNLLFIGMGANGPLPGGCRLFANAPASSVLGATVGLDGVARYAMPIPNNSALEGLNMDFQCVTVRKGPGSKFGVVELSNGLRVRLGNSIAGCP